MDKPKGLPGAQILQVILADTTHTINETWEARPVWTQGIGPQNFILFIPVSVFTSGPPNLYFTPEYDVRASGVLADFYPILVLLRQQRFPLLLPSDRTYSVR